MKNGKMRLLGVVSLVSTLMGCAAQEEVQLGVRVHPADPVAGVPVDVRIEGVDPGGTVTLTARSEDSFGLVFQGTATYEADDEGIVDLETRAPLEGGYEGADGLGVFYSMKPVMDEPGPSRNYLFHNQDDILVTLDAETSGGMTASGEVRWHFQTPGVELVRDSVSESGLYGVLYRPAGQGPFPGLILLGGSGGGLEEWWARIMASQGFASLALAYFNYEDLPVELMEIPLETVEKGLRWLQAQDAVDGDRIGVMGGSKGGELGLLAAATYPEIRAVVGCVPSGIVWQGDHEVVVGSSWTMGGRPLPYANWFFSQESMAKFMAGESVSLRGAYDMERNEPGAIDAATIPVENINGPVLLVSGTDDQMWPSDVFSDRIMERLEEHGHPFERTHLKIVGGGHLVFLPIFMTGGNREAVPFMFGGTAKADAHGAVEFWGVMLDFLHRHLGS